MRRRRQTRCSRNWRPSARPGKPPSASSLSSGCCSIHPASPIAAPSNPLSSRKPSQHTCTVLARCVSCEHLLAGADAVREHACLGRRPWRRHSTARAQHLRRRLRHLEARHRCPATAGWPPAASLSTSRAFVPLPPPPPLRTLRCGPHHHCLSASCLMPTPAVEHLLSPLMWSSSGENGKLVGDPLQGKVPGLSQGAACVQVHSRIPSLSPANPRLKAPAAPTMSHLRPADGAAARGSVTHRGSTTPRRESSSGIPRLWHILSYKKALCVSLSLL